MVNPVLTSLTRGGVVESTHRGAWVVVDKTGAVLDHCGDVDQLVFARSATKSLQALPLIETGAADHFELSPAELAVAVASHSAEPVHTACVEGLLGRLGLDEHALKCGPSRPWFSHPDAPTHSVSNCCSGKHAGFLALTLHLDADIETYLSREHPAQVAMHRAVTEMTDTSDPDVKVDGCGAPTFRLPLSGLATGIARVANPDQLAPERAAACRRITDAVAANPVMIAGASHRLCTDLVAASQGRLFAKVGADGIYVVGVVGGNEALAVTIDDGAERGASHLVIELLKSRALLSSTELETLASWSDPIRRNASGQAVGTIAVNLGSPQ